MYLPRNKEPETRLAISHNPVTAIIGPRQCGKSTLARQIIADYPNTVYLDLERPSDLQKLDNPEWYLSSLKGSLICIDEILSCPEK